MRAQEHLCSVRMALLHVDVDSLAISPSTLVCMQHVFTFPLFSSKCSSVWGLIAGWLLKLRCDFDKHDGYRVAVERFHMTPRRSLWCNKTPPPGPKPLLTAATLVYQSNRLWAELFAQVNVCITAVEWKRSTSHWVSLLSSEVRAINRRYFGIPGF